MFPKEARSTSRVEVIRSREDGTSRGDDVVAREGRVVFHVDPLGMLEVTMSPLELQEFILGHLFAEGVIEGAGELAGVTVAERDGWTEVLVELVLPEGGKARAAPSGGPPARLGLIQTACASSAPRDARPLQPLRGSLGVRAADLLRVPSQLRGLTEMFVRTGAFHYAFLMDRDAAPRVGAYDIGRHTAVDKVIGKALLAGEPLPSLFLFTTGRVSSDVAGKCVRARVPLVASRGAPLEGAVAVARATGLGLVGFLRGGRFNVYAGEGHVVWD
jgi:FdhD protein